MNLFTLSLGLAVAWMAFSSLNKLKVCVDAATDSSQFGKAKCPADWGFPDEQFWWAALVAGIVFTLLFLYKVVTIAFPELDVAGKYGAKAKQLAMMFGIKKL